jgi:small ligand-binding sensory domain FIST
MNTGLSFAAALSPRSDSAEAAREASQEACERLPGTANLAIVFASAHHQEHFREIADVLGRELENALVIGCTGESILCNQVEVESQPAIAVWLARLPEVELLPMHLEFVPTAEGGSFVGWHDRFPPEGAANEILLLLADPFSFPADVMLSRLNDDWPGLVVTGGMASGGWQPGQNRLLCNGHVLERGAVALVLRGAVEVQTVVSQGCRPIGRSFVVTKADRNAILELGGVPALVQLRQLFGELAPEDQQLVQHGLHVGQAISEYQDHFGRGDFLVRNVQGIDSDQNAIVIGDYVRVGQTVQFHVRDAATADEDLSSLLASAQKAQAAAVQGALVFTCNGRGTRLFDEPHHDAQCLARHFDVPTAGFFAQGEIGPVGGKSFLHGFTASMALFRADNSAR